MKVFRLCLQYFFLSNKVPRALSLVIRNVNLATHRIYHIHFLNAAVKHRKYGYLILYAIILKGFHYMALHKHCSNKRLLDILKASSQSHNFKPLYVNFGTTPKLHKAYWHVKKKRPLIYYGTSCPTPNAELLRYILAKLLIQIYYSTSCPTPNAELLRYILAKRLIQIYYSIFRLDSTS
jgi:hypothetical protein